ncbi:TonB-dependent receptor [Echinicola jeungdonensis]|uniref:SusC/RagA family TonB-linked outer membrane protein n=1 Tax=Echinicola jeungdonensis TaxID=709343 RepID=A0ABV5J9G4_9BACT|nr:TonB-dependent receptor [Echinicola jeungdonensis]MDN3670439.1 TonB-dependent receptor [Echinicola jeungdonensis]
MENRILRQIIMLSKYFVGAFIFQLFFTAVLMANTTNAQKSLSETVVTVQVENGGLEEIIGQLHQQSEFKFSFNQGKVDVRTIKLDLNKVDSPLVEVLKEISSKSNLKFVRVDNLIHITRKNPSELSAREENILVKVTGKVSGSDGGPLIGATVLEKGTSNGTVTDLDGKFSLNVSEDATLVISFLGYIAKELPVGDRTSFEIFLEPDVSSLQEVIVVGYGEQNKATLTGAVEQVDSKVFEDRAVTNPALSLQGQTPGLVVTRGSSRPGNEGLKLQIRGATSVNGGSPLIVIDGVPAVNDNAFYNMNPDDIESISILKDGAASIYGSRAANGVLLVTTKRGAVGDIKVNLTSNFRVNAIGIRPAVSGLRKYAEMNIEATDEDLAYAGTAWYWGWVDRETLVRMRDEGPGIYTTQYWGDIFLGEGNRFDDMYGTSYSNQTNLSVSGGSERSKYRVSAGFAENVGNLKPAYDGKEQYNLRLNHSYQISDRINIETGLSYFRSHVSGPSGGLGITSLAYDPPLFPAKNPYGQWYANFGVAGNRHSIANVIEGGREESYADQLKLSIAATFDITDDLNFRTTASLDKEFWDREKYKINIPMYTWFGEKAPESVNPNSSFEKIKRNISYGNYGGFLNYKKSLGSDHHLAMMVGSTAELRKTDELQGYRQGFEDNGIYNLNVASPENNVTNKGLASNWGFLSYLGRFNYNYKDKYLLELTGRRDGSSKFHPDYRWSNFGGASVGWVVTEEQFMQDVTILDFLKFKASYGEMGGQVGIGNHDYLSAVTLGSTIFGKSASLQTTAAVQGLTSLTRTWERIGVANYGAEFRLLNHRLTGSFDYFTKKNDGMLIAVNYPDLLGGEAPKTNSGVLEVKGWEAMLSWKSNLGDFKYNVSLNMSDTRNELVSMDGVNIYHAGLNKTIQGYPLDAYFLYQTDGFFANEAEVEAYYEQLNNGGEVPNSDNQSIRLRPGDTKKVNLDGDGIINGSGTTVDGDGDVKFMGDAAPHYTYGINLGFQFKGFDFGTFFQGVVNQNIVRTDGMAYPFVTVGNNQTTAYQGKTWTEENPNTSYPRLTFNTSRARWNWKNNDFMLQNNRYLRMKTLVFGYTFNDLKMGNYTMDRIRLYFSGNDLFEITSVKDGWDPEFGSSSNSSYPFNRTYSIGLNVTF